MKHGMTTQALGAMVRTDLTFADLRAALRAGLADFLACPLYGLFFAAIYVVGGLALLYAVMQAGQSAWLIAAMAGFPLVAPFAAVGLYEVSRRRLAGEPVSWRPVLGALRSRGDDQVMLMGSFIFVAFAFWIIIAHTISLVFLADAGAQGIDVLLTPAGLAMLAVGGAVGALLAWALFAMTVTSLPMLLDRDIDAVSAIIVSLKVVSANLGVMLGWAILVAATLALAMAPLFLGLLVALPVLGHATFHLYRRAVGR